MTQAQLIERLRGALAPCASLELAVLFGSWARGNPRNDSDVDVAILPTSDWELAAELELQGKLTLAAKADVDLVRLDQAPILLRWEVVRHGVLIVGDEGRYAHYRAEVLIEHADIAPLLERTARHYARRIAELGVPR